MDRRRRQAQSALFDLDAVDRLQLGLPIVLGNGIPLFARSSRQHQLALSSVAHLAKGLVMLDYERAAVAAD